MKEFTPRKRHYPDQGCTLQSVKSGPVEFTLFLIDQRLFSDNIFTTEEIIFRRASFIFSITLNRLSSIYQRQNFVPNSSLFKKIVRYGIFLPQTRLFGGVRGPRSSCEPQMVAKSIFSRSKINIFHEGQNRLGFIFPVSPVTQKRSWLSAILL